MVKIGKPDNPALGKGKPPHLPVGKGRTDEEHRRESRASGPLEAPAKEAAEIPPDARTEHDQPPGGFRKGVAGRITMVEDEEG